MTDADVAAPAKSRRGGKRPGAGRRKKEFRGPSALPEIDQAAALQAPAPADIESVASGRAKAAIGALVRVIQFGKSEQAKVNACNKILDRGYGKPSVDAGGFAQMSLFPVGVNIDVTIANDIRDEARKFANLAIETLAAIAERGDAESARVAAAGSLIDRGIGTVATAKMSDSVVPTRPVGKKEQAALDAENAARGKYATPPPPRSAMTETIQ